MSYPPPSRSRGPNEWQIAGNLVTQGAGIYDQFRQSQIADNQAQLAEEDRRGRLRILMEEAAQKKADDTFAKIKAAREEAEAKSKGEREAADRAQKETARAESERVRKEIAMGKTVPGKSVGGVVGPDEVMPYGQDEAYRMLLGSGDLSAKEYADATKPKAPPGRAPIMKAGKDGFLHEWDAETRTWNNTGLEAPANAGQRDRVSVQTIGGRKVRLNLDTNEQTDLGPGDGETQKDLSPGEVDKLTELGGKKANTEYLRDSFKDSYSGAGNGIQNVVGKYTGTNQDQVLWWQNYQTMVNQVRNDLFGASLTPGEKAEFQKTIVTTGTAPSVARKNLARQVEILNNATERKRETYKAGKRVNQAQVDAALGGAAPAANGSARDYGKEYGF